MRYPLANPRIPKAQTIEIIQNRATTVREDFLSAGSAVNAPSPTMTAIIERMVSLDFSEKGCRGRKEYVR